MTLKEQFAKSKSILITGTDTNQIKIVISRKSRFIRKDAEKILEKIQNSEVETKNITIEFNAPLCSKAKAFLESVGIKKLD